MNNLRIEDYGYKDFFQETEGRFGQERRAGSCQSNSGTQGKLYGGIRYGRKKCKAQGLDLLQPRQRADLSGHGRFCADKAQSYGRRHNIQGIR